MPVPAVDSLPAALRNLLAARGIVRPTEIQELAWPALARGGDALLVAPTGTGKTEAALLPLLADRLARPAPGVAILYITPLRALNRDLEHRLVDWAEALGLKAGVRHGDTPASVRARQARAPPDVLVTTPETLQLLLVGRSLRAAVAQLAAVIVDEIHELASNDRGAQLAVSLERLETLVGRPVRRVGLSATVGNPQEIADFLSPHPTTPVQVLVSRAPKEFRIQVRPPVEDLSSLPPALRTELRAEDALLGALLALVEEVRAHRSSLLFVNTRPSAEALAARIARLAPDLPVAVHHGSLSRETRERAEAAFKAGELRVLVATSSLELGIDIGLADHVVQFGSPRQASRLLQRVGRAGHRLGAVSSGTVVGIDDEDLEEAAVLARRALAREVEEVRVRPRNRLALAQQLVASLRAEKELLEGPTLDLLRRAVPTRDLTDGEVHELLAYLQTLGSLREGQGRLRPGRGTLERFYATLSLIPEEKTYPLRDLGSRRLLGTLDERFVVTQILPRPDATFLLQGTTWRVVEFRPEELLVEPVKEIGAEPRWVGEEIPVPFAVAQEIGRLRREGSLEAYPLTEEARHRLARRCARLAALPAYPSDRTITVELHGRLAVLGCCFGSRTNATLAALWAGLGTSKWGARTESLLVEPTWIVLGFPLAPTEEELRSLLTVDPQVVRGLMERLVPQSPEYRWTFTTVARKFGVLPLGSDARQLRTLEPLLESTQSTPLAEEALEKALFDRHDLDHAEAVLEDLGRGRLNLAIVPPLPTSLGRSVLEQLKWQQLGDRPPPTLLKAVGDRLRKEPLLLLCIRCGFERTVTAEGFASSGGSLCLICKGALSAVLSPRREEDVARLRKYLKARQRAGHGRKPVRPPDRKVMEEAYATAELLSTHGAQALLALAARGVGPAAARRILAKMYPTEEELLSELLRAERTYAQTRAFWD